MSEQSTVLLDIKGLKKHFPVKGSMPWSGVKAVIRAVDGISFDVRAGETFSLVGESGCGKTTTAKMVLLLEKPTEGNIEFEGTDVAQFKGSQLHDYRGAVQAVFQDPWSSLSPRMRARFIIAEPLMVNKGLSARSPELGERVAQLLDDVGLDPNSIDNYPHEFSGGQRQRIAVARALSLNPRIIVLDEPVSALDVSIRAQIMNMLKDLQAEYGVSYLLIAHNLATVRYLSHRVAVMYLGQIVEYGDSEELFTNPLHPYTKALISAALSTRPDIQRDEIVLTGEVPSPANPPAGCRFHTRCPWAFDRCVTEEPKVKEMAPRHTVSCHLFD
jgi:oligopeptide/dipeptide ABC transporter ATP-binding protein